MPAALSPLFDLKLHTVSDCKANNLNLELKPENLLIYCIDNRGSVVFVLLCR